MDWEKRSDRLARQATRLDSIRFLCVGLHKNMFFSSNTVSAWYEKKIEPAIAAVCSERLEKCRKYKFQN